MNPFAARTFRFGLMLFLLTQSGCLLVAREVVKAFDAQRDAQSLQESAEPAGAAELPPGIRIVRDVAYGSDPKQRFDVYAPAVAPASNASRAPVIFMVHGGGWAFGDKGARNVIENKVRRWVPRGFILISVNNRLVPAADPLAQVGDLALALKVAQDQAASWGGDRARFILMGHSAGAHLIALLSVSPRLRTQAGDAPWLGSILLDSAALDVPQLMQLPHFGLYDRAFGSDPAQWRAASPYDQLAAATPPLLAVCSSQRRMSCPQARRFVAKAAALGSRDTVLEQDLNHAQINQRLGSEGAYTDAVEVFMASLDSRAAALLKAPAATPR